MLINSDQFGNYLLLCHSRYASLLPIPRSLATFFSADFSSAFSCGHDFAHALGEAYGLGCGRQLLLFGFGDQERDFAFDVSSGFELFENFSGATAQEFFVDLRDLAGDDHVAGFSQNLANIGKRFQQPVRSFVEHLRARRVFYAFQQFAALS